MENQRPLPTEMARAHSNSAPAAVTTRRPTDPDHWQSESNEDETCRICKSEGEPDQPLFYPCKCSGSIKYVHQDCLMEWLERSQKKHCELCKTPFRFTKLYQRDMPAQLPLPVFAKHMLLNLGETIKFWVRGVFVAVIWLGVLPWVIRHIWAALFYLADGGWWIHTKNQPHPVLGAAIEATRAGYENYDTCPRTSFSMERSTSAKITAPMNTFWKFFVDQAHNNASFANLSYKDVMRAMFYPAAFNSYGLPHGSRNITLGNRTWTMDPSVATFGMKPEMIMPPSNDSVLGRFEFLQNLTRHAGLNRQIITVLEGQLITIVVVVCFILVFLIREWVVQQQPGINVGDGFAAQFPNPAREAENAVNEAAQVDRGLDEIAADLERELFNVMDARPRPPAPPRIGAQGAGEREWEEWRAMEEQARRDGAHFVRRADNHLRGPHTNLDENGAIIPTIGTSNNPTTEYLLRGETNEETMRIVHDRLYEHVRFIIPGIAGKVTDMMMQDGVDSVLEYIDYEDEIHVHLTRTLLDYNQKLVEEGQSPILTKTKGKEHILEALISQMAEDNHARYPERVVKFLMGLELDLLLRALGDPQEGGKIIRALNTLNGSVEVLNDNEYTWMAAKLVEALENPETPDDWEDDEQSDDDEPSPTRTEEYLRQVRERRQRNHGEILPDFDHDEDAPDNRPVPDGGSNPERARYLAKQAARRALGPGQIEVAGEPFKFNFTREQLGLDYTHTEDAARSLPTPMSTAGPSSRHSTPQYGREEAEENMVGLNASPVIPGDETPWEEREPTAEAAARGVVGYDAYGHEMITEEELMRRLNASDNESTAQDEDTPEASAIETELRTPEEIAETARLEAAAEEARIEAAKPKTLAGKLAQWLWGDVEAEDADAGTDDEHIVEDIDAEAPFVAVNHGHHEHHHDHDHEIENDGDRDAPIQEALANGGFADELDPLDPEAMDEAEDFDGIMELVGMRGPIFGLIQNALIGIILLAITIFIGIWIPYIVGKLTLLLAANPTKTFKVPLRLIFKAAAVLQDVAIVFFGGCYYTVIKTISVTLSVFGTDNSFFAEKNSGIAGLGAVDAVKYAGSALERVISDLVLAFSPDSEIPYFSAVSHESFIYLKSLLSSIFNVTNIRDLFKDLFQNNTAGGGSEVAPFVSVVDVQKAMARPFISSLSWLVRLPMLLSKPESWVITLSSPPREVALDMALCHWSAMDRTYAIMAGYGSFIALGAAYVRKGSPFSSSTTGQEWEALFIDILNQAGGVLKVILIISIEMLVFPLYCGLLLDVATLPLFENASLMSRVLFFAKSPFTSMFVHWFVGTCYMFHFALFVSMCRKILRKGTLYFIRDPDDPTFHPVRDVLERNVATQLRKISFSAAVYGALVLVCLGGVVWSLAGIFRGVLPIRWSSNSPVLEFPIDLLFYNFLMPLAVRYFKPSEGLHAMYKWWFVQSAHFLRLSHFLLGERRLDEELWPRPGSSAKVKTLSKKQQQQVIDAHCPDPPDAVEAQDPTPEVAALAEQYANNGRYVRAPASDMVRIPKQASVFLTVNSRNERLDGLPEVGDELHGMHNQHFKMVYNPPNFRVRICVFILALWAFAAVTGCSATLIPLVIGRWIFERILPQEVERNDVYAFALGANLVGSVGYTIYHLRTFFNRAYTTLTSSTLLSLVRHTVSLLVRVGKLVTVYTSFILLLPALVAALIEFYILLPLHSYIVPNETHTIHFIQSWTLGLLVFHIARRWLLDTDSGWGLGTSRAAAALRRCVRRGYADPDVSLAMRGFVVPITLLSLLLLGIPALGAKAVVAMGMVADKTRVWRAAYPVMMGIMTAAGSAVVAVQKLGVWRRRVRDEVYLIGERLHNFRDVGKGGRRGGRGWRRVDT